jgi:hypothetical protein
MASRFLPIVAKLSSTQVWSITPDAAHGSMSFAPMSIVRYLTDPRWVRRNATAAS